MSNIPGNTHIAKTIQSCSRLIGWILRTWCEYNDNIVEDADARFTSFRTLQNATTQLFSVHSVNKKNEEVSYLMS